MPTCVNKCGKASYRINSKFMCKNCYKSSKEKENIIGNMIEKYLENTKWLVINN